LQVVIANRFCPADPYNGCMKTEITENKSIQSLSAHLPQNWTVRRIRKLEHSWLVEQCRGGEKSVPGDPFDASADTSSDYLLAARAMDALLHEYRMKDDVLVVMVENPRRIKVNPADSSSLNSSQIHGLFSRLLHSLDPAFVGSGSFMTREMGLDSYERGSSVISEVLSDDQVGKVLCGMLEAMPYMARKLREPVHLLFAGAGLDQLTIMEHLHYLVSECDMAGEFPSLADMAGKTHEKLEPYEVKLSLLGVRDDAIAILKTHLSTISDSDTADALKKALAQMPWRKRAAINRDLMLLRQQLDDRLYGMDSVKDEVVAGIAGALISSGGVIRPPRLLLHGKPGTGKTAIAKAIAAALNMPFRSISMNGISTAVSIVGVEPLFRSPQPGQIIQSILSAGVLNPLLLLDEIDKCGNSSEHGSPLDALLQVLDPSQNRQFKDLYMGVPVDVSEVFFIATANDITAMPEPLLDRFHLIEVPEYSVEEKGLIIPFLLDQIKQEFDLGQVPKLGSDVLTQMGRDVLPYAGLRRIKQVIWKMVCDEAARCGNLESFKQHLDLQNAVCPDLSAQGKSPSIGFL